MTDHLTTSFVPDYAVIPGRSVAETLDKLEMTQADLAERTGLDLKTIQGIIDGTVPIKSDIAIQLEKVFHVPARFWINLQKNFQEFTGKL